MTRELHRRLVILPLSPWSERARWALDHHQLPYQTIIHAPFLGERRLRRLVGPHKPRVTVPVLLAGDQVLSESWDIALYAEREGRGAPLLPPERAAEIRGWNDRADEMMAVGRALVMGAMLASPEALDESLPPAVPGFLRPLLRPVTGYGSRWFARKYELRLDQAPAQVAQIRAALRALRTALAASSPYLLGSFSYADIAAATSLQGIAPVADRHLRLGPATRRAWTNEELKAEFPDLVAWRDRIYDQHRRP